MTRFFFLLLLGALQITACAKPTSSIEGQRLSPLRYYNYSCAQIASEMTRVTRRAQDITGYVNERSQYDTLKVATSVVLFWPVVFSLDGDTTEAQEYAHLKGEFAALNEASDQKNCDIEVVNDPFITPDTVVVEKTVQTEIETENGDVEQVTTVETVETYEVIPETETQEPAPNSSVLPPM